MDYSNLFVCLMGLCTVFVGLICIIVLVSVMSNVVRRTDAKTAAPAIPAPAAAPAVSAVTPEMVAAVSAAIAEELGTDVSAIRIVSMKRSEEEKNHEEVQSQCKRHRL